jgi:hypothetical protein
LVYSNDFWIKDTRRAKNRLKDVITDAQEARTRCPDKGRRRLLARRCASALSHAARMPGLVATVVVAYPLTELIKDPSDFVAKMELPVQIFAGTADMYKNCCVIDMARRLADAAKGTSPPMLMLHEYNGVGHGFNLVTGARKDQPAGHDAMERKMAKLKQALPAEATK